MTYKEEDISVIIPTYNRSEDLGITLKSILKAGGEIKEIIIVDQSKDNKTKDMIKKLKEKKIRYIYSKTPSITIARNLGVRNVSKKSKLICFFDDDVLLKSSYFPGIVRIFNKYNAIAVAGFVPPESITRDGILELFLKKVFFLQRKSKDKAEIVSAYGNIYPLNLSKIINAQWLQGVNMAYKKEIFKKMSFDENLLGYTIAEDTDFNYRLYKKYPESLFITPFAGIEHRSSNKERYETKKMSYINQIDHFYFNFKNLNKNAGEKIIFIWSLIGISLLRIIKFLFSFRKKDLEKVSFFFESLFYCLSNIEKIKKGRLREFKLE